MPNSYLKETPTFLLYPENEILIISIINRIFYFPFRPSVIHPPLLRDTIETEKITKKSGKNQSKCHFINESFVAVRQNINTKLLFVMKCIRPGGWGVPANWNCHQNSPELMGPEGCQSLVLAHSLVTVKEQHSQRPMRRYSDPWDGRQWDRNWGKLDGIWLIL